jgi:hypothetical protein
MEELKEVKESLVNLSSEVDELELSPPPLWVAQFVRWLRIGFALFVLASVALGVVGCAAQASVPWRPASQVLSDRILQDLLKVTTSVPAEEVDPVVKGMRAWSVPGKRGTLIVIDYNNPNLCGSLGCLYSAVWAQDRDAAKLMFTRYFKPEVPKSVRLFEVAQTPETKPVPCITVSQVEQSNQLRRSTLCYQGGDQYEVMDSAVTPIKE